GKIAFVVSGGIFGVTPVPGGNSVSTIDLKSRTKSPINIAVGTAPTGVAITPDGKTAFVTNMMSDSVSTIDVKTRTKNPNDITVGSGPLAAAAPPSRRRPSATPSQRSP